LQYIVSYPYNSSWCVRMIILNHPLADFSKLTREFEIVGHRARLQLGWFIIGFTKVILLAFPSKVMMATIGDIRLSRLHGTLPQFFRIRKPVQTFLSWAQELWKGFSFRPKSPPRSDTVSLESQNGATSGRQDRSEADDEFGTVSRRQTGILDNVNRVQPSPTVSDEMEIRVIPS
jgi:hypothetical protein